MLHDAGDYTILSDVLRLVLQLYGKRKARPSKAVLDTLTDASSPTSSRQRELLGQLLPYKMDHAEGVRAAGLCVAKGAAAALVRATRRSQQARDGAVRLR